MMTPVESDGLQRRSSSLSFLDPRATYYRFLILLLNVLLTLGSHYCFDAPSAIENSLVEHLGIKTEQYHLFFSTSSWSHMVMGLVIGILIDILGNRKVVMALSLLIIVGQSGFAFGASVSSYYLMLLSRFVFSLGSGPIQVVQSCIAAKWFHGKEEALAFGITLTTGHLGSILSFLLTATINEKTNVPTTLWFADFLAMFSFGCAMLFYWLDQRADGILFDENGTRIEYARLADSMEPTIQIHDDGEDTPFADAPPSSLETKLAKKKKKIDFKQLIRFPHSVWLLYVIAMCFYSVIFPWNSTSSQYFQDSYHLKSPQASRVSGVIYDVAFFLGPLGGFLVDKTSKRGLALIVGMFSIVPAMLMFKHTTTDISYFPILPMLLLGVSYSFVPPIIWGSLDLLVPFEALGTATGVLSFLQMLGVGCSQLVIGYMKQNFDFSVVLWYFFLVAFSGFLLSILVTITTAVLRNKPDNTAQFLALDNDEDHIA